MGDVCFNPTEEFFKCRGSLFPILPNKPSWCVKPIIPPGPNLVALWWCLAFLAFAVCCSSIICYCFWGTIRMWALIRWIQKRIRWIQKRIRWIQKRIRWIRERISTVRDRFSCRDGTDTVNSSTDSTQSHQDIPLAGGKDCDNNIATEASVMLPATETDSPVGSSECTGSPGTSGHSSSLQ